MKALELQGGAAGMKRALGIGMMLLMAVSVALFGQTLSGKWTLDVEFDTLAGSISDYFDYTSTLTLTYTVDTWDFESVSVINDSGWVDQSFSADGTVAVFDVGSGLDFTTAGLFEKFDVDVSFPFASLEIDLDFELKDSDLKLDIGVEGTTDAVALDIELTFGGDDNDVCDLNWGGVEIDVELPFRCAEIDASLEVSCGGFERVCFDVDGIVVPNIPWFTLGAELCFELESKTLVLTPAFDFGVDVCFDVYIEQLNGGGLGPNSVLTLSDFVVSGIGLTCEIGGVVSFVGQSYFGEGSKPGLLAGTEYWEGYQLSTTNQACCGPLDFSIAVYFDENSTDLFDVAGFSASLSYDLGDNLTFSFAHDFSTVAPGVNLWTLGFEVTW